MSASRSLAHGLEPEHRFRCDACGNVTRFDVVAAARTRRYHHFDLGGDGRVEEEVVLSSEVEQVICRWCARDDAITVEPAPSANTPGAVGPRGEDPGSGRPPGGNCVSAR